MSDSWSFGLSEHSRLLRLGGKERLELPSRLIFWIVLSGKTNLT
jgi:hypothetical protein